jgi:patatin-like phospholipase/acyl hydrolase
MAKYRILSIDGGGIRGLITTILLQRIAAEPGMSSFLENTDLLAGTSTGGLLALGIAKGIPLERIRETYEFQGPKIFDDSWTDNIRDLGKIRGADYSIKPLKAELNTLFGQTNLGQLRKKVLIAAFDLDNGDDTARSWKPKLFHNFAGPGNDRSELAVNVGLYTSAAPTYFPSVDGYIDGGVYANNPAMCALAQSQDKRYAPTPALDDVVIFSMGTGKNLEYISGNSLDWGYGQWIKPLIDLMFDGVSGIADFQCSQLLHERYHRLSPTLPAKPKIAMDGVKRIPEMIRIAETVDLTETLRWLRKEWL